MKKYLLTLIILCVFGQIAKGQPDLTFVPNSVIVSPTTQHIGLPITITMSVKNIGDEASGICRTRIFYSSTNYYGDALLFADISLEALAAGASSNNIQFVHPIPYNFTEDTYYFFIELNHFGDTPESNPFNNEAVSGPITIDPAPWAEQNIPYPIIFIHGITGNDGAWNTLINDLQNTYGWSNGGNMNFCLNYDASVSTSDTTTGINNDYHDFTNISNLHPDDFYTVNFDVNYDGTPYANSIINESNQSGIVKQGLAIRDAINHVLAIPGSRDKVILVGHSMGGLAARQYLQYPNMWTDPGVNHHIAKLVTIGTPHGGSSAFDPDILGLFAADPSSEAVRDLRATYTVSNNKGVYLFGGEEDLDYMKDHQICCDFYNADVNCNGTLQLHHITGINEKTISTDLTYSCIVGIGDPLSPNEDGDGIVMSDSANINNYLPVNASVFTLPKTSGQYTIWHSELPKQFAGIVKALDEPNDNNNGHAYKVSSDQVYYGIISYQSNNNAARDYDNYKINIPANGTLNIQVYNIPLSQFYINVFNSSLTSVYSIRSNGKSFIDTITPSLSAGNYFVVLSGYPNSTSWNYPYAFKVTYSPAANTYCSGTTTLHSPTGTVTDGSGNNDYNNNLDCRWKIQPSGATSITLTFSSFDVSNPGDTVYVYDGGTTASPLLLAWTGNTIPVVVTSTGGTMLVRFSTDASNTAPGWTANYTSTIIPTSCAGTTTLLTAPSGIFSDASGPGNYANNTNCTWLISIPGSFAITLNFSDFQTEPINDVVNVYDGNDNSSPLLGSFSGSTIPPTLTSSGGAMFVEFISNDTITFAGWTASYTSLIPSSTDGIIKYEYWFDNEFASRICTSVSMQNTYNLNTSLPTAGLNIGLHSFHIRFIDYQGQWSSVISEVFYKIPILPGGTRKITEYEYWFDNDFVTKVVQSVSPQQTYILNTALSSSSLLLGLHNFHIRYKDDGGQWSSVISEVFYKLRITESLPNLITAYRYWFDMADSTMVNQNLPIPVNPYQLVQNIYVGNLPIDNHSVHFQFKDILGQWSSIISAQFTFTGPQEQTTITSQTITNGQSNCFDALQTITVAGNGATFIIQTGGSATMIAGQNIIYFPNTTVQSGGYMYGHISPSGPWCVPVQAPSIVTVPTGIEEFAKQSFFKVYPNPTTGSFTLELSEVSETSVVKVEIYGMRGEKILNDQFTGEKKHEFSLESKPTGIYFIRVISGDNLGSQKIIKQ